MTVSPEIPVNLAGFLLPFAPSQRLPVQDRMGGGSFATRMETTRATSSIEEMANTGRAVTPETVTPRDPRGAELVAAQLRIEIARLRHEGSFRGRHEHETGEDEGDEAGGRDITPYRRLLALSANAAGGRSHLHLEV